MICSPHPEKRQHRTERPGNRDFTAPSENQRKVPAENRLPLNRIHPLLSSGDTRYPRSSERRRALIMRPCNFEYAVESDFGIILSHAVRRGLMDLSN